MNRAHDWRRACAACGAGVLALTAAAEASAVECKDLPSPVYGIGASAPKPVFKKVAGALAAVSPPTTVIYQSPGACYGPNYIINGTKMTGTASYWEAGGAEKSCNLRLTGDDAQFGAGGTYATTCPGIAALPADVGEFLGANQPYVFIVPKASSQLSISAAAAYFAYGFGTAGEAAPWVDETQLIKRDPNSGAAILVAAAIGVPVDKLKGVDGATNGNTVTLVATSPNPEAAIGFCSGETAESNTATVSILAYQHYEQTCGYWPSTTQSSFDKRNVRDGHYHLWAPIHFFAKTDAQGKIADPAAASLIGYFTGEVAAPVGVDMLSLEIKGGAVPDCAMEVKRSSDLGPVSSYAPAEPCGCFFDFVATGETTCDACSANAECPVNAPNCRYGYCEVN